MMIANPAEPATPWPTRTLEDANLRSGLAEKLDEAVAAGRLENLHSVVAIRDGHLLLERYYEGTDESWGRPLGPVAFDSSTLHDLRSVTKSVVSLLYGIALNQGIVPPPDETLLDQFPEYGDLGAAPDRRRITIDHTLTMTMGIAWDESRPYSGRRNSEIAMENSNDRFRFILEQPIVADPGTSWTYNGGASAILGRLIVKGADTSLPDFGNKVLFSPLGISSFEWARGRDGVASAASGLRLRPLDLAKIGQLVLDNGHWNGEQIVPADWIATSTTPKTKTEDGLDYGYQWWLGKGLQDGRRWIAGFGNGGQRLIVIPDLDLVVVVLAGNYNKDDAWRNAVEIMGKIILPALVE